jgi:molybdopterin-guanine dinucleotide biosynthesis protein A
VDAIVLAGGLGTRMGGLDKSGLLLGGETFLERILRLLEPLVDSAVVVASRGRRFPDIRARVIHDEQEGVGPLMGLYTGMKASGAEWSFVITVDTPLIRPELVRLLEDRAKGWDAVVPCSGTGIEPLCAVYSRRCIPAMECVVGERRIAAFWPFVRLRLLHRPEVESVDPEGLSFMNVNTPADYESVRSAFASGAAGPPVVRRESGIGCQSVGSRSVLPVPISPDPGLTFLANGSLVEARKHPLGGDAGPGGDP